ncbi:MAG: sigma factor-like helix-turn-helix DNA-binding protein [Acidithiobacillus sp.]
MSRSPEEACKILGLHPSVFVLDGSNNGQIIAAFRIKAARAHPDRGGSDKKMRELIEARDILVRDVPATRHRARMLVDPKVAEIEAFAHRARCDIASAWLALPKIKKYGLSLDHPRAAKLARGEANRSTRAEWGSGLTMPERDGRAGVIDSDTPISAEKGAMQVDEAQIAPRFREAKEKEGKRWPMPLINADAAFTTYAPGQIDEGSEKDWQITRTLQLKAAVKPRDQAVLELRFEQGLSIAEIAESLNKTPAAIYKSIDRIKPLMRDARERNDWENEHNGMRLGTGDAPVVLGKTGQLGWDLGAEVRK